MPPFKTGLLKRKINDKEDNKSTKSEENLDAEEIFGDDICLEQTEDVTDSELENDANDISDCERDEVLYNDDIDSTLGNEELYNESAESSDITDSEASDSDEEVGESKKSTSDDSGAESGPTHSSCSHESQRPTVEKKTVTENNKKKTKDCINKLADKIQETANIQSVVLKDEYESGDTSDEEERRNTVGDIPMWWYNEYPHIGYDLDGRRIIKPPQRDHIDDFLKKCEDPEFWRTVRDPSTGQDVVLSKSDLELISRIREGRVPNPEHNEYEPWVEWFSREVLATPLRAFPEHKRSFLPSRSEQLQVSRLVHALKMGWTKTRKQIANERRANREKKFYNLWGSGDSEQLRGIHRHIPAPRRPLPSHAESYNPPPEYLLDKKEMKEWEKLNTTPWKRKYTFLPTQYQNLRSVPAFPRYVRERFLRCLDLYLAPRTIKMRLTISPKDLVPVLPSPRDLQPFPTSEVLQFRGHTDLVRCCYFSPDGQYLVSGSDDGTLKVWESGTARCVHSVRLGGAVRCASWSPASSLPLVGAACDR